MVRVRVFKESDANFRLPPHGIGLSVEVLEAPRASAQRHATVCASNPFDAIHLLEEHLAERCTCSGLAARRKENAPSLGI